MDCDMVKDLNMIFCGFECQEGGLVLHEVQGVRILGGC